MMFSYRIETVFEDTAYKMNHKALVICRASFGTLGAIIMSGVIGFLPKIAAESKTTHIALCTGDTGMCV